jgi:RND family efflux transporter MFP subunit
VRVATVARGHVGGLADVAGVTSAFRTATVSAEVAGRIVERHVEPGASVEAGDPLVTLDDARLAIAVDEAQANLKARSVDVAEAQRELRRGDELRRKGALSEGQLDALRFATERAESARDLAAAARRRAQVVLDDAVVRAPFAGTVERVDVQVGDYLAPGTPVATVADFARVRLRAGVTAAEAAGLVPGLQARVSIRALGGYSAPAEIHSVGLMADPASGTYPVEVWLENSDAQLRSGMVGQLHLDTPDDGLAVVVPVSAILRRQGRLSVFVVEQQNGELRAHVRAVRIGRQRGTSVELIDGVSEGERVVVDGLFALTDGAAVYLDDLAAQGDTAWND